MNNGTIILSKLQLENKYKDNCVAKLMESKYGMLTEYNDSEKYSLEDLYKTLAFDEERINSNQNDNSDVKKKISNTKNTGIKDKLYKKLGFSFKKDISKDNHEVFDMLRIFNLLYSFEKLKTSEGFKIIDVLANPHLAHINSKYHHSDCYNENIEMVFDLVCYNVDDAESRIKEFKQMDITWRSLMSRINMHVISNTALRNPQLMNDEFQLLETKLNKNFIERMSDIDKTFNTSNESVMKTFLNMLLGFIIKCEDTDIDELNSELFAHSAINQSTTLFYAEDNPPKISWDMVSDMIKNKSENRKTLFSYVNYHRPFNEEFEKKALHALRYSKDVAQLFVGFNESDFNDGIYIDWLVAIMQEIIRVKDEKPTVNNHKLNYSNKKITLSTLLSRKKMEDDSVTAIVKLAWIRNVENRYCINYGAGDLIEQKRKIENLLLQIKHYVFSQKDLNVIIDMHNYLIDALDIACIVRYIAEEYENIFEDSISQKIQPQYKSMKFILNDKCANVYDFFRVLFTAYEKDRDEIFDLIAKKIKSTKSVIYNSDDLHISFGFEHKLTKKCGTKISFLLEFDVIPKNNIFLYKDFHLILDDDSIDRLSEYGLNKFFNVNPP